MQFGIKIVLVISSDNVIFSFFYLWLILQYLISQQLSSLDGNVIGIFQAFRQHFVNIVKTIIQPLAAPFRSCCDKINRQDQNPDVSSICTLTLGYHIFHVFTFWRTFKNPILF